MSGHSKWSTIRRKKGAADAKRGQAFTKLGKAITVAAKDGADPTTNFKLRLAVDQARALNMPSANIAKAISRGEGTSDEGRPEEIIYEGYGPGGVAIIVECATDNKNRTYADVRTQFSKHGGSIAEPGAVTYQFDQKGVIQLEPSDIEAASLAAIDVGAEDVEVDGGVLSVYTAPQRLSSVQTQLQDQDLKPVSAELSFVPKQSILVQDPVQATKILKLMSGLEDLDDVTATYSNFDIPSRLMEQI